MIPIQSLARHHVHDVNMMHHKLTAPLNWTARNQYSCRLSNSQYTRINTHFFEPKIYLPSIIALPGIQR